MFCLVSLKIQTVLNSCLLWAVLIVESSGAGGGGGGG